MKRYTLPLFLFLCHYAALGQSIDYENQIQPIFNNSCMPCHGESNPSSGLNLTSYEDVMAGGNGGSVIVIGDYENSILWQEVSSGDMPNNTANNALNIPDLNSAELELIQNWILDLQCMTMDCEGDCALGECIENNISIHEESYSKKAIKIVDILGREQAHSYHQDMLLYIYEDGSIRKVKHIK